MSSILCYITILLSHVLLMSGILYDVTILLSHMCSS